MFEITLNGKTLYHPNSAECNVSEAVIYESLNDAGYMNITIPFSNPVYDEIQERKGKITVYKDNVEMWYGEVRELTVDFSKNKHIYIVGEASYLNDSVQPQREIKGTRYQVLQELIEHHNSMVEVDRQFKVGTIGSDASVHITIVTDWEYTLDSIRDHLCRDEEYFRIRHIGNERYIDVMPLESYGKRSEQTILFGDNLLEYLERINGKDIATVCIPLGSTLDDEKIEGYENYITCEAANDGKNYVELPGAVNRLGRITKVVHFNVLSDPSALVTAAVNYLQNSQYAKLNLELSAVDLSILHSDIDNYNVGDYVRAICEPMGMDAWFPIREKETDLLNLANNSIQVGAKATQSFISQQIESIENLEKLMPNKNMILNTALKNASNLINANGTNGNVSIRVDDDGKPYEILIMNADNIEQSTQAWRWNLNGFGHGTKQAGEPDFTWEANIAMTMDGEIVAEKGSVAGFDILMAKNAGEFVGNYLDARSDKGFIQVGFSEQNGDSVIRLHQGNNEVWISPTAISINGTDVQGTLNTAINGLNNLSGSIGGLNSYIKSVDDARISDFNTLSSRCDSLYNYISGVHNLVKTLHGLSD